MAVWLDAVAESFSSEAGDEVVGVVDEKHGVGDAVFLGEFGEKFSGDRDRIRGKQPGVEDSVGCWIDGGVQPVLLVVDSDRLLIDGSLPKEVLDETFEFVYDFDEEPAPMLTRRWGELPAATPLTSEAGDNLFLTAYELTDWIENDSDGSAIFLYDE